MANVISKDEIRRSLGEMETSKNKITVDIPNERRFVKFRFSSQDSFSRFEAVKEAQNIMSDAIEDTYGNMTTELINAYEGLNSLMERIKALELDLVRLGK